MSTGFAGQYFPEYFLCPRRLRTYGYYPLRQALPDLRNRFGACADAGGQTPEIFSVPAQKVCYRSQMVIESPAVETDTDMII
ncbi:MAG: hypothetical protein IJ523_08300 [Succinivibrionaceae bacterium]|nr:hypothetical protein [Succinivibrionaceae bacterium]